MVSRKIFVFLLKIQGHYHLPSDETLKRFYESKIKSRTADLEFIQYAAHQLGGDIAIQLKKASKQTDKRMDHIKYEAFLMTSQKLPKEIYLAYGKTNFRNQKH